MAMHLGEGVMPGRMCQNLKYNSYSGFEINPLVILISYVNFSGYYFYRPPNLFSRYYLTLFGV